MDPDGPDDDVIAPGDNVASSKLELEIENHVLTATAKLSDGTEGRVFSRLARNKDRLFGYSCHICGVVCLYGERMLQIHIAGRKHQARLNVAVFDAEQYRAALVIKQKAPTSNESGSGENAASGDVPERPVKEEASSKPTARLQVVLDSYREGPLVGLEFCVELTEGNASNDPSYSCMLCDINNKNESDITTHMISLQHRLKYLQRHYPTVRNVLAPYRNSKTDNGAQVFCRVVQTVCEAIEDHHGRMAPKVYDAADFERNRVKYSQDIAFGSHFDERTGPKFVEVIDHKVLEDLANAEDRSGQGTVKETGTGTGTGTGMGTGTVKRYRNRNDRGSLDSISSISSANSVMSISSSDGPNEGDRARLRKRSPLNAGRSVQERHVITGPRVDYRGDERYRTARHRSADGAAADVGDPRVHPGAVRKTQVIPTPKQLSLQSAAIAHERYKWEKYRITLEIAVTQLTKSLKDYEKNPEKHPLYSEEWKKFWNRRYKELQLEKKDPQKHNFKPEWIEFWTKRMKELHDEEVERKKVEIRAKMNLPAEGEERTDELREQFVLKVPSGTGKGARSSERKPNQVQSTPVLIDVNSDEEEDDYRGGQPIRSRGRSRGPSRGDWERPRYRSSSRSRRSRSPISDYSDMDEVYRRYPGHGGGGGGGYPTERERWSRMEQRVDYDTWAKNYYGPNKTVFVRTEFDAGNDAPLNFIAVCRLLTAFEEYLGSLGPKVIDLMAKALALEKVKANSADDLLLNEDNCMFLETVKEKLKGHMMAETIDPPKIVPIKKAVRNIARLLHEASKREPIETPADEELSGDSLPATEGNAAPSGSTVSGAGAGPDKIAIATQLAKALVSQGKTDFSTDELEQLITVYTAMEQMSREKNAITSTKAYMAALPAAPVVAPAETKEVPPSIVSERSRIDAPPGRTGARGDHRRAQRNDFGAASSSSGFGLKGIETAEPDMMASASGTGMLENLSDSDLQTLLQSFKELSNDEQMHLISYLRKLERTEPERVERLRRYVDFDSLNDRNSRDYHRRRSEDDEPDDYRQNDDVDVFDKFRTSSASASVGRNQVPKKVPTNHQQMSIQQQMPSRQMEQQQTSNQHQPQQQKKPGGSRLLDDSEDEDDYSYDDILRAASKNVSKTSLDAHDSSSSQSQRVNANEAGSNAAAASFSDTQNLIANLMESLQKSVSDAKSMSANGPDYTNPIMTIGSLAGAGGGGDGASAKSVGNISASGSNNPVPMPPYYSPQLPLTQQRPQGPQGLLRPQGPQGLQIPANMSMQQLGSFGQSQQQMGQSQGAAVGQPQGTPMGQSQASSMGQMQQPFGQPFMYQGQMFGANGAQQAQQSQQAQQYGYGNFGYY